MDWIRVEDKVPELIDCGRYFESKIVLCTDGKSIFFGTAERMKRRKKVEFKQYNNMCYCYSVKKITHWMHLPNLPGD